MRREPMFTTTSESLDAPVRRQFLVAAVIATAGALLPGGTTLMAAEQSPTQTAADWRSVIQTMFPHASVDPMLYAPTAEALLGAAAKDTDTKQLLSAGWERLLSECNGDWHGATPEQRTAAIRAIQGTPLFPLLRQTTVFTFYANPRVWEAFGYEGDAWKFGGYLGKNLNTLDWLPDPPQPPRKLPDG